MNKMLFLPIGFFLQFALAQVEFDFSGNDNYSRSELIDQTGIPNEYANVPESRKDFLAAQAAAHLQDFYFSEGYFSATIEVARARKNGGDLLLFDISEGRPYHFGHIGIDQPTWANFNYSLDQLTLQPYKEFSGTGIVTDLENIRKAYQNEGYLSATVTQESTIDSASNLVHLVYKVNPGRRVYQDQLTVRAIKGQSYIGPAGSKGLSDTENIASLWPNQKGDVVRSTDISRVRNKLLSTGAYSRVSIRDSLADSTATQSQILIDVSEKVPGQWGGTLFYEELIGLGAQANFKYLNLGGSWHQTHAQTLWAQRRQRVSLGYAHPLIWGTFLRFEDRVIVNRESLPLPENPDSLERRVEVINRGKISYPLTSLIRLATLTDLRYVDVNASQVRFKWEPSITFNWTDDRIEPRRGIKSTYNFGQGGPFNPAKRHWYHEWNNRFYIPTSQSSTWAIAADYGKIFQDANLDDARLFYQGGFRSVRGYPARSIFPAQGTADSLQTGTAPEYYRVSNEFRFNLPERWIGNLQLVQFFDYAYIKDLDPSFSSTTQKALGLGIRYRLSLLTLRLDYTFKKNLDDPFGMEPFSWGRFSLDLSQAI